MRSRPDQLRLRFPRRKRRGRPPKPGRRPVPHRARPVFIRARALHIQVRICDPIPRLRTKRFATTIRRALCGGCQKPGFRVCQFSIQSNHIHLLVEADHHHALARGMQGLCIRLAKGINKRLGRKGQVFAHRYAMTHVTTRRQMRATYCYVLHNGRRHGAHIVGADIYSSARYFDGWSRPIGLAPPDLEDKPPVAKPTLPLLAKQWRFCGLIDPDETPPAARHER